MYLRVISTNVNYDIRVSNCLNVIAGDSSTGKTELIRCLNKKKGFTIETDATKVVTSVDPDLLELLPAGYLVVIDIDDLPDSTLIDAVSTLKRDDIYFILLGRKYIQRLSLDLTNTFQFLTVRGITKNISFN